MGQLVVNALLNAALIAPPAIAFTMMFGIMRFPNFAVGGFVTLGAYAAWAADVQMGLPLSAAVAVAMAFTALATWLSDVIVFKPMRSYSSVTLLVVSVALALILENIVRFAYGNQVRGFDLPLTRPYTWNDLHMTVDQIWVIAGGITVAVVTHGLLAYTRLGKAMRATADNFDLAEVRGIETRKVLAVTWLYCGGLFGAAGVMAGLDLVIEPRVGWNLTIPIFAAAILGGIGSPYGAMLGSVLVGLAEEFTILVLPSSYKVAVSFAIIALLLLFRPSGLLGQAEVRK